jgi:hypothetical protein
MKRHTCFLILLLFLSSGLVSGCNGGGGTPAGPQASVQAYYGYGNNNAGYTQTDPHAYVVVDGADPNCATGQDVNYFRDNTDSTGYATFPITCGSELLLAVRYPDNSSVGNGTSNCDAINGTDPNSNGVWIYNTFSSFASPATKLPCAQASTLFTISPGQMYTTSPVSAITMTGPAGSFISEFGMPYVFIQILLGPYWVQ